MAILLSVTAVRITVSSSSFADPTKYFGCELGAQTQMDLKNERFIVNGAHDPSKLAELLNGFIRKFVLCPNCDNPETTLVSHLQNYIFE